MFALCLKTNSGILQEPLCEWVHTVSGGSLRRPPVLIWRVLGQPSQEQLKELSAPWNLPYQASHSPEQIVKRWWPLSSGCSNLPQKIPYSDESVQLLKLPKQPARHYLRVKGRSPWRRLARKLPPERAVWLLQGEGYPRQPPDLSTFPTQFRQRITSHEGPTQMVIVHMHHLWSFPCSCCRHSRPIKTFSGRSPKSLQQICLVLQMAVLIFHILTQL